MCNRISIQQLTIIDKENAVKEYFIAALVLPLTVKLAVDYKTNTYYEFDSIQFIITAEYNY